MQLNVAFYSYKGPQRVAAALRSVRAFQGDSEIPIVVCQDNDGGQSDQAYAEVCDLYGANHVVLAEHGHMQGACHAACRWSGGDQVLVCSDDVLIPRGLIPSLRQFFTSNKAHPIVRKIAGIYLHCWDRADLIRMGQHGVIPELAEFTEKDFYADGGDWFIKHLDGVLPYGGWTEPSPADKLGIVSNVHGSAFVASAQWWNEVGGCGGIACWQNDSVYSFRIGQWTDAFIVRLPWLPSLAHYGGAAATPPDPAGWTDKSVNALVAEHGSAYRLWAPLAYAEEFCGGPPLLPTHGKGPFVPPLDRIELGLKLRADSLQWRYRKEIDALNYDYKATAQPGFQDADHQCD